MLVIRNPRPEPRVELICRAGQYFYTCSLCGPDFAYESAPGFRHHMNSRHELELSHIPKYAPVALGDVKVWVMSESEVDEFKRKMDKYDAKRTARSRSRYASRKSRRNGRSPAPPPERPGGGAYWRRAWGRSPSDGGLRDYDPAPEDHGRQPRGSPLSSWCSESRDATPFPYPYGQPPLIREPSMEDAFRLFLQCSKMPYPGMGSYPLTYGEPGQYGRHEGSPGFPTCERRYEHSPYPSQRQVSASATRPESSDSEVAEPGVSTDDDVSAPVLARFSPLRQPSGETSARNSRGRTPGGRAKRQRLGESYSPSRASRLGTQKSSPSSARSPGPEVIRSSDRDMDMGQAYVDLLLPRTHHGTGGRLRRQRRRGNMDVAAPPVIKPPDTATPVSDPATGAIRPRITLRASPPFNPDSSSIDSIISPNVLPSSASTPYQTDPLCTSTPNFENSAPMTVTPCASDPPPSPLAHSTVNDPTHANVNDSSLKIHSGVPATTVSRQTFSQFVDADVAPDPTVIPETQLNIATGNTLPIPSMVRDPLWSSTSTKFIGLNEHVSDDSNSMNPTIGSYVDRFAEDTNRAYASSSTDALADCAQLVNELSCDENANMIPVTTGLEDISNPDIDSPDKVGITLSKPPDANPVPDDVPLLAYINSSSETTIELTQSSYPIPLTLMATSSCSLPCLSISSSEELTPERLARSEVYANKRGIRSKTSVVSTTQDNPVVSSRIEIKDKPKKTVIASAVSSVGGSSPSESEPVESSSVIRSAPTTPHSMKASCTANKRPASDLSDRPPISMPRGQGGWVWPTVRPESDSSKSRSNKTAATRNRVSCTSDPTRYKPVIGRSSSGRVNVKSKNSLSTKKNAIFDPIASRLSAPVPSGALVPLTLNTEPPPLNLPDESTESSRPEPPKVPRAEREVLALLRRRVPSVELVRLPDSEVRVATPSPSTTSSKITEGEVWNWPNGTLLLGYKSSTGVVESTRIPLTCNKDDDMRLVGQFLVDNKVYSSDDDCVPVVSLRRSGGDGNIAIPGSLATYGDGCNDTVGSLFIVSSYLDRLLKEGQPGASREQLINTLKGKISFRKAEVVEQIADILLTLTERLWK